MRNLVKRTLGRRAAGAVLVLAAVAAVLASRPAILGQAAKVKGKEKKAEAAAPVVDRMLPGVPGIEQVEYINQELERLWKDNKVQPSDRCSDYEFIRRASLDIVGRIATIKEIDEFMAQPAATRRSWLIEKLLKSDDYAHNFANIWTTLLMTRSTPKMYRDQMYLYLYDEFSKEDSDWSKIVTELLTAKGKTNENGAVNFILAHLGEKVPNNEQKANGHYEMVPVTSRTTKLFLGLQTQCTQCHDHPFWPDVWQQKHFWGVNAFFRQVDAPQGGIPLAGENKKKLMASGQKELRDDPSVNTTGIVPYERRSGTLFYTRATFIDGTKVPPDTPKSRRQVLAEYVTKNPYFGKAAVNRMWGHFFGVSFTENNVADFGDHNPITTPKLAEGESKDWLLGKLAKDWTEKYNHNPRHLIRWICNSRAYGLSSVANPSNISRDAKKLFARMQLKAMSPEQLFDSLMVATQYQGVANASDKKNLKEEWLRKLVVNFGDDEGNEQTFNGTVVQALLLMNGQDINKAIMDQEYGTVAHVLKQPGITPQKALAHLYLAALNRPPTQEEYDRILSPNMVVLPRGPRPKTPEQTREFWTGFYQDIFWAILNSNEFFLNH